MRAFFSKTALIIPVLTMLAIMEILTYKPDWFWSLFIILISIVFLASLYLGGFIQKRKLRQLLYLILPLFYTLSAISLFVLAQKSLTQHFFIGGVSLVLGLVLYNIATLKKYRYETSQEVVLRSAEEKRKRIVLTINQAFVLLTCFFIFANLFGIIYLLSFPIWKALIIAVFVLFFSTLQLLAEIFSWQRALIYASIVSLSLIQIFWSLTFWPTNYIANATIIIASLYIILGILEHYSHQALTKRLIKIYFGIVIVAVGIVLLTTQWTPR